MQWRVLLPCLALAGCIVHQPPLKTRPIVQDADGQASVTAQPPARAQFSLAESQDVPRIDCGAKLSQEDDLVRSVIAQRVQEGSYYAAYAQVQALPAKVASVAILRADILRRLGAPEAERWYEAMLDGCMAAQARHGLGLVAAERQDYALARKHLTEASRLQPADSSVHNDLGMVYLYLGQDRQAEFELKTASELAPNDRQPALNLGLLALLRGERATWWGMRERLSPTQDERMSLDRLCRQISQRWSDMRSRLTAETPRTAVGCPVSPMQ
ncbi:MAG: hypothetical protein VW625_07600 [Perlucidibaca sp.]